MAEAATTPPADPLAGLIDIPLPPPVSLLPQTWPSRIAIVLAVAGLIAGVWWFVRWWRANRYRRAALAELAGIERAFAANSAGSLPLKGGGLGWGSSCDALGYGWTPTGGTTSPESARSARCSRSR